MRLTVKIDLTSVTGLNEQNLYQFAIQFNSILLSIPGHLFCSHAYIKYIGTYKTQVT